MTRVLVGSIICLWLSGCGLLYKNKYEAPGIRLYSNQDAQFVQDTGHKCSCIRHNYQSLFHLSSKDIGTVNIILSGNSQSNDRSSSTLGFYVDALSYANIATNEEGVRKEPLLSQVLLHEIGHHFLVTDYPGITDRVWLNEGLAGILEMAQFENFHFEYPLFNPILFEIVDGHKSRSGLYKDVITSDWDNFHKKGMKELNYAVAWSIVYYMLEYVLDRDMSLGDKIKALYTLDVDELMKHEKSWQRFLRVFNEDRFLMDLAVDPTHHPLTAHWAVRELSRIRSKTKTK